MPDELVNVRYMVDDVESADRLLHRSPRLRAAHRRGARVRRRQPRQPAPAAQRADQLGRPADAGRPRARTPGGWNRIHFIVDDIEQPRSSGCARPASSFRNDIVTGPGGQQILLEDPSGNPIELFQPAA